MRQLAPMHLALALIAALFPLLACGSGSLTTARAARWACPSPTPLPYGEGGPVKSIIRHTRPITEGGDWDEPIYYTEWEQEYGATQAGPPFPAPTPYAIKGTTFVLGQRVELGPTHVTVRAESGPLADRPGVAPGSQQLQFVRLLWINHSLDPIAIDYATALRIRAVTKSDGRQLTGDGWGITAEALALAENERLPQQIPPGPSEVRVPIITAAGTVTTVELELRADPNYRPNLPQPTVGARTPTALPEATLLPTAQSANPDLRRPEPDTLVVQWTTGSLQNIGPSCGDPGALTNWADGRHVSWGNDVDLNAASPAGTDRLIQVILNQVGKPYIWGAKGPEAFDCSGLATWSYAQIGIRIPQGTAGQWPQMQPVDANALQPGDLIFFAIDGGEIDHVGVLVGDLDGDGRWDMVHAASPRLGVRIDTDVFGSAYYAPRIRGFRTAR